jgi:hypothetical protein
MEKQVKGYTRKGKNGKTIVVKAHTRKCSGATCGKDAGKEFEGCYLTKNGAPTSKAFDKFAKENDKNVERLREVEEKFGKKSKQYQKANERYESTQRNWLGSPEYKTFRKFLRKHNKQRKESGTV